MEPETQMPTIYEALIKRRCDSVLHFAPHVSIPVMRAGVYVHGT
jgi:hypothetical protein